MKYILYAILLLTFSCQNKENDKKTADKIAKKVPIIKKYGFTFNDFSVVEDTLQSGDTFSTILEAYTLPDSLKTFDVTEKIKDSFNIKNIRAGKAFLTFSDKKNKKNLKALVYVQDKTSFLVVDLRDSIRVEIKKRPTIIKRRTIAAELDGSLSETLSKKGVSADLANELAQIYKYSIDFFKLKKGDKFAVTIKEKYFENGEYLGVDEVEATYFEYKGKKIYAFPYKLNENQTVMLKLSLPNKPNLYQDLVNHPRVLKVVALSGGYSRDDANKMLAENHGVIASFSRALTEGLSAKQSDDQFDALLDSTIQSIFNASVNKK